MKKISILLVFVFALGVATTSCREETNETEVELSTDDDADDEIENTVQEGVDEVKENTGMGGEDDI